MSIMILHSDQCACVRCMRSAAAADGLVSARRAKLPRPAANSVLNPKGRRPATRDTRLEAAIRETEREEAQLKAEREAIAKARRVTEGVILPLLYATIGTICAVCIVAQLVKAFGK